MNSNKKLEDEIQYKEVIKSPIRLFGWVYILFIGVLLVIGIYYVKNLDSINYNESPQTLNDSLGLYQDKPLKRGGLMPSMDIKLISSPSTEMIAKGKEQYITLCATCHGESGQGDGVAGVALNPKPRNFLDSDGWTNGRKFIDLYKTLQEGILKNGMAAYEYLPPEERVGMIHYIRTMADYPEITQQEVADLDAAYNISAGVNVPNQIPVAAAMNKISDESEKLIGSNKIEEFLSANSNDAGAKLLASYTNAPERTITAIITNGIPNTLEKFIESVSAQPSSLGLNPSVIQLSKSEYSDLYVFLRKISKKSNG